VHGPTADRLALRSPLGWEDNGPRTLARLPFVVMRPVRSCPVNGLICNLGQDARES
jgi:hypothetical protein